MKAFSNYDLVNRSPANKFDFHIEANLERKLIKLACKKILNFLEDIVPDFKTDTNVETCIKNFFSTFNLAKSQNLITYGGVPERNFLALSILSQFLNPNIYVESGFYKGSSLLACSSPKNLSTIIGFDPDHKNYCVELPRHLKVNLKQNDFADFDFKKYDLTNSLLYFDDHINTAQRIIQASDKGFKNLIFDDSCGLMGTTERVYPSLPSLFFIDNVNEIDEDYTISWSKDRIRRSYKLFGIFNLSIKKKHYFSFKFDKYTLELCREAKKRILSINKIPDLNDYIYTENLMPNDISQHFVILN